MVKKKDENDVVSTGDAFQDLLGRLNKKFGEGTAMRLGDYSHQNPGNAIPTGSMSLDIALAGGIPRGRVTEIYGIESSGKSTLALHVAAQAQKLGGKVFYIDVENALNPEYARRIGVDMDNLVISQPGSGEEALQVCDECLRSNLIDLIVVDSVAALTPRAEIEGEIGEAHIARLARLMSQSMRRFASSINRSKTALIFINQLRTDLSVTYGNPNVTTGGRALRFFSSVRLEVTKVKAIEQGEKNVIGYRTKVKVVKSKVSSPFKYAEFDLMYFPEEMQGISHEGELLDLGLELGILSKSGNWLKYGDMSLGAGREQARNYLRNNQNVRESLETQIRSEIDEFNPPEDFTPPIDEESA